MNVERTMIVNSGRMRSMDNAELAAFEAGDREVAAFWQAVKARLDAAGLTNRELRLTTGDGLRLSVGPATPVGDDWETELEVRGRDATEVLEALDTALDPELRAGADSPLTAPTGERLLSMAEYAGMRETALSISRAMGAIGEDLFVALVNTCKRSIGPGLEQAVADGTVPVDRLASAREALELELELFEAAALFRRRIARVQDRVRDHVRTEEANRGAPPAIEVIRHNAPKNGGGT